jgi:hypothetical protein
MNFVPERPSDVGVIRDDEVKTVAVGEVKSVRKSKDNKCERFLDNFDNCFINKIYINI